MKGRCPVMMQGYDLNNLKNGDNYRKCSEVFGEERWGGGEELCGHLSLRCLFDFQVETPKRQLGTLG